MFTVRDLVRSLREGRFTSYGCYPRFWLTSEGATVSHAAIMADVWTFARATRDQSKDGFCVVACDVNWEDPNMICDVTGERIESAYAEDEAAEH